MKYQIRKSQINDIHDIMKAHKISIQEICSKDYNPEQIAKWSDFNYSPEIWANSVNNEFHYVVEVNGTIEGFCHSAAYENGEGEIKGLYFTPKVAGLGIGREAFEIALNHLRERQCSRIYITATKTAKGFYEKMGFRAIESKLFHIRGIDVECYQMERFL